MYVKQTNGRSFDTDFPVKDNPNKIMSINKRGILVDHGDRDGTFMFYPWSAIELVATSNEDEKRKLGSL